MSKPINEALRLARAAHDAGPCLLGEASLALLDIYVFLLQSGRSLDESIQGRSVAARFASHALAALLRRAAVPHMRTPTSRRQARGQGSATECDGHTAEGGRACPDTIGC